MIVSRSGKVVDVCGYDPSATSRKLQAVTAALANDRPTTGETVILILHQAIHVPNMDHHLLSTMQSRTNDIIINDSPKFLTAVPTDNDHCILAPSEDSTDTTRLPLRLQGTIPYLNVRKPTTAEYADCEHIDLTADAPDWDPRTTKYQLTEDALVDNAGRLLERGDMEDRHFISSFSSGLSTNPCTISKTISQEHAVLHDIDPRLNDHCFSQQLRDMVNISSVRSAYKAPAVDAIKLARNWGIGIEAAPKTIRATAQRGARTTLHPSLTRRRPTNDRFIRLRRLNHNLYGDLMKANVKSKRMNEHVHIFGADNG